MVRFTRIKSNSNEKMAVTNWSATKFIEKIAVDDSKLNVTQFRSLPFIQETESDKERDGLPNMTICTTCRASCHPWR